MKTKYTLTILMALALNAPVTPSLAATLVTDPTPHYWVDNVKKVVNFSTMPTLLARVVSLQASDKYWDRIDVELNYNTPSTNDAQLSALKAKFPGYNLHNVVTDKKDDFHLQIPSAGIDTVVAGSAVMDGPVFSYQVYSSKAASAQVWAAFNDTTKPFAIVTAQAVANVPTTVLLEQVVGSDVCEAWLGQSGHQVVDTLGDALNAFGSLKNAAVASGAKMESTRTNLVTQALSDCIELNDSSGAGRLSVATFRDVLKLKVENTFAKPVGISTRDSSEKDVIDLQYIEVRAGK